MAKSKWLRVMVVSGGLISASLVALNAQCAGMRPPPPAEPVVVIPVRPHPEAVWVNGHYVWKRRVHEWVWVPGHWQIRRGNHWVVVY
jgi:hypothetical protein